MRLLNAYKSSHFSFQKLLTRRQYKEGEIFIRLGDNVEAAAASVETLVLSPAVYVAGFFLPLFFAGVAVVV